MKKVQKFSFLIVFVSLSVFSQTDKGIHVDLLIEQANQLFYNANYSSAQSRYLQALELSQKNQNPLQIVKSQNGIAICHYYLRDKRTAIEWLNKSLSLINKYGIKELKAKTIYYKAVMFIELGKVDSAETYTYQAINIWDMDKNYEPISQAYSALTDIYLDKTKNYNKALKSIEHAEYYSNLTNNKNLIAFTSVKRFFLNYTLLHDYKTALSYINKAEELYTKYGKAEDINYAIEMKALCLAKLGDTLAADYIERWFYFKDSIFQKSKSENIAKYETFYKANEFKRENKILNEDIRLKKTLLISTIFIIVLLVLIVVLSVNTRRNRIKRLKVESLLKERKALDNMRKEKERISKELHDNVGAQLSYLISNLEWLISNPKSSCQGDEYNSRISALIDSSRSAILSLRGAIWTISSRVLTVEGFVDRFKQYVLKIVEFNEAVDVSFFENLNEQSLLAPANAINTFRVGQEALSNSLKHSKCSVIVISFEIVGDYLHFTLQDNGVGFETENKDKSNCFGLVNMCERAEEMNAFLTINSSKENGTSIELKVPIYFEQHEDN